RPRLPDCRRSGAGAGRGRRRQYRQYRRADRQPAGPDRPGQDGACFLVMLGTGAVLISTTQLLPQLLQTELGYTAMLAGLALSPGGIFTLIMMPVVGALISVVQPKYLIMIGASIVALAMWHLTGLNGDISYGYAA